MRQFAVIGIGRFGHSVAITLAEQGCQVLAIDSSEEEIEAVADFVTQAVQLDSTDEKALRAIGITDMDVVVVAIGVNKEASIMTTLLLKELGIKTVIAKAISHMHGKVLKRIGADSIVYPEGDMGQRLAKSLACPDILDNLELSKDYGIYEVIAPKQFIGKSLRQLEIRANWGFNVIAIKTPKPEGKDMNINVSPLADDVLASGSILVVVANNKSIQNFKDKIESL